MMKNAFYLIRIIQIFFKFGIILFIPNMLNNTDLANYGFINTIVNIFIILYGLELWYFYNRETATKNNTDNLLLNQYNNYLILYIIFTPILFFLLDDFNLRIMLMVVTFSLISHFIQEIVRSLIHLGMLTESAIVNVTQSIWVIAFFVLHRAYLEQILLCMILGAILSLMLGLYFLKQLRIREIFRLKSFNLYRFTNDLKKVKLYFISSLCMRLALSAPILFFKYNNIENSLIIYSYYFSLATGMEFFIYHFIQAKFIARLVYDNTSDKVSYLKCKKAYFFQNAYFIIMLLTGSFVFCKFILPFLISNRVIIEGIYYGGFILLSVAVMNFSNYYAIILYTQHNDRSNVIGPPLAFILTFVIVLFYYFIAKNAEQIGYVYILVFAIVLSIIRFLFWLKYDHYEKNAYLY